MLFWNMKKNFFDLLNVPLVSKHDSNLFPSYGGLTAVLRVLLTPSSVRLGMRYGCECNVLCDGGIHSFLRREC